MGGVTDLPQRKSSRKGGKDMSRRHKFLFIEEWYEGGINHVSAYGERERTEIDKLCEEADKYSPYDYVCPNESDTEQEYKSRLQARINDGSEVKYYN